MTISNGYFDINDSNIGTRYGKLTVIRFHDVTSWSAKYIFADAIAGMRSWNAFVICGVRKELISRVGIVLSRMKIIRSLF